jgi:hypothetical protein
MVIIPIVCNHNSKRNKQKWHATNVDLVKAPMLAEDYVPASQYDHEALAALSPRSRGE